MEEHQKHIRKMKERVLSIAYMRPYRTLIQLALSDKLPKELMLDIEEFCGKGRIGDLVFSMYQSKGTFHKRWYTSQAKKYSKQELLKLNSYCQLGYWERVRKYWTRQDILWIIHDGMYYVKYP